MPRQDLHNQFSLNVKLAMAAAVLASPWLASAQIAPDDIVRARGRGPSMPGRHRNGVRPSRPGGEFSARWCQLTRGDQVARHGPYLELYADGTTARQGSYARGIQTGLWARWLPDGRLGRYRTLAPGEASRFIPQPEDLCPPGTMRDRSTGHDHKKRMWSSCERKNEDGDTVLEGPYVTWDQELTTPRSPLQTAPDHDLFGRYTPRAASRIRWPLPARTSGGGRNIRKGSLARRQPGLLL